MTNELKYKFKMPIGDRSKDGHGQCDYYYVNSNKPVEEVREAHFLIKEKTGVDLDKVCKNYGDPYLEEYVAERLVELGFFGSLTDEEYDNSCELDDEVYTMTSYGLAKLWMFLLQLADFDLKLEMTNNDVENLSFFGFDKKGRHIEFNGYGVFY